MPDNISNVIADRFTAHGVNLMRLEEGSRRKVLYQLKLLENQLVIEITESELDELVRNDAKLRRLTALLADASRSISTAYGRIIEIQNNDLTKIGLLEAETTAAIINSAVTVEIMSVSVTPEMMEVLVSETLIEGAPSAEWWRRQAGNLRRNFADEMRQGVLRGESVQDLVRRVRGTSTGKRKTLYTASGQKRVVYEFSGGIMDAATRDATSLVRTSVVTVANNASMLTYRQNADVIKGLQTQSTLDTRTSPICIARSGRVWDLEGNPVSPPPNNERFPGPPAWHFGCRSRLLPVLKSWEELSKQRGTIGKMKEVPPSTQESMDGQVADDLTYEQWLKGQSTEVQKEVLGPTRWQMWQDGEITSLTQLIDQQGNPLTIEELESAQ